MLCGSPAEIVEQLRAYEATGVDQLAFGFPGDLEHEEAVETIRLFGEQVIPHFDKDPVHSTTRLRASA
jgi:alkanesulfonate monooxygenase SsuD/methylene tetrahydromethanopterin reductase-like flavin-dependent oxidoreductase (luciferase family)